MEQIFGPDSKKKQRNVVKNKVITSGIRYGDISRPSIYNKTEITECSEVTNQLEETINKQDPNVNYIECISDDDEIYLDSREMDVLKVDHNVDISNARPKNTQNYIPGRKIYEIQDICAVCTKKFSCQRDLVKHALQAHPNKKAFKCQYCPALFSKLKSITAHFNRSHVKILQRRDFQYQPLSRYSLETNGNVIFDIFSNRKGKTYPVENNCAACERKFLLQKDLFKHAQENHPDAKVFKCLYCPTLFSKLNSVTTHYKRSHSELRKSFICEYCKMTFFTNFLLERHRRAHTEYRPFVCKQCNKSYKYKRNLIVHIKTHPENKGFSATSVTDYSINEQCENREQVISAEEGSTANQQQNFLPGNEYCETNEQIVSSVNNENGLNISEVITEGGNFDTVLNQYPFKCNACERAYKYKKHWELHQKSHDHHVEVTEVISVDDTTSNEYDSVFYNSTYFIIDELDTDQESIENLSGEAFAPENYADSYDYESFSQVDAQNVNMSTNVCGIYTENSKCLQAVTKNIQHHPKMKIFKCPYCDDKFYGLESLSEHITIKNHPQKRYICKVCLKSFDRNGDLKRHMRIHTGERPYACDKCEKNYNQSTQLKRHKEKNHPDDIGPKRSHCDLCPKSFCRESDLKRHLRIAKHLQRHHPEIEPLKCSYCDENFDSLDSLSVHISSKNHSQKRNICKLCLKSFDRNSDLKRHMITHTDERSFPCEICGEAFKQSIQLKRHKQSTHEHRDQSLIFSCNICPKSFELEQTLKRHMRVHDRQTHFPCPMCDKTFITKYDWRRHQATHSSRIDLVCEFCLASFDDIQILNYHLNGHSGERKYLCTLCDKSFKEKSHLISHRRSHITRYGCEDNCNE